METGGTDALFGSFTTAVGLALGELLLVSGRAEELGGCLAAVETAAYATLLASDLLHKGPSPRGKSLTTVALRVVRAWHEETEDLAGIGEAIRVLQDVLEAMGVRYISAPYREVCSKE